MSDSRDAPADPAGTQTAPALASPYLGVGQVLDDTFEIRALLGSGGMGRVYEAHDRNLNRTVAIKVASPLAPGSLRREAQALAPLAHPAVPAVYHLGKYEGLEYLVMERISGHTLEAHINQREETKRPFSVREVLELLVPIAEGLAAIHRANISHRDVKPANIILAPGNRIVLIDFGLFRPEFDTNGDRGVSGSPDYMAPEVVLNQLERFAGHAVDIYALGVVAFELLTGRPPYEGETLARVLTAHVWSTIPTVAAIRPDVPPALSRLIEAMLAKSWTDRPEGCDAIAWEMRALLEQEARAERASISVLFVDDDPDMLELLKLVVAKTDPDARVRCAPDADQAIELLRDEEPDVMLVDLDLPGMNGIELVMFLRGENLAQDCTLAFISGKSPSLSKDLLQQLGATRLIPKGRGIEDRIAPLLEAVRRDRRMSEPPRGRS